MRATDTHYGMAWSDFRQILQDLGFRIVREGEYSYAGETRHQIVAADVRRKLLLHATSHIARGAEVVSKSFVYGVVRRRSDIGHDAFTQATRTLVNFNSHSLDLNRTVWSFHANTDRPLQERLLALAVVAEFANWGLDPAGEIGPNRTLPLLLNDIHMANAAWPLAQMFWEFVADCPADVREFITSAP